jgi:hypothetical protein
VGVAGMAVSRGVCMCVCVCQYNHKCVCRL